MASIVFHHVDDIAFGKCLRHARGEPFIVYKEVGLFLLLSAARAHPPSYGPSFLRGRHRERGVARLARQPSSHASQPFLCPTLYRHRRENDNRFIHVRAARRVSPVRFLKASLGNDRSLRPAISYAKNSTLRSRVDIRVPFQCTNVPQIEPRRRETGGRRKGTRFSLFTVNLMKRKGE